MTEGVNKEQVRAAEVPVENKIDTKPATNGVAWYDVVVVLLFFMLSQAINKRVGKSL